MRTIEELRALLSAAEAELEAATRRTDLNAAARKLMRAKEALKSAEKAASGATGMTSSLDLPRHPGAS